MASVGLKKRPRLEDMIGTGVSIRPSVDPWTELGDDPRIRMYRHMDPAVYRDMEMKLAASRRFRDEVRFAAMRDGVSVGQTMAASGLGGGSAVRASDVVCDHDSKVEESIAMDEVARRQSLENARARIQDVQRQANEAVQVNSAAHQMRDLGHAIGAVGAGPRGAPGIVADLAGYMTGRTTADFTVLMQMLVQAGYVTASRAAQLISDIGEAVARAESSAVYPPHLARLEG